MLRAGVGDERGVGAVGGEVERRAVAPAADELGGQLLLAAGVVARGLGELAAEAPRRPGAACGRRGRCRWRRAGRAPAPAGERVLLVAVAEDELAGADRPPVAVLQRRALAGQRVDAAALDRRLREAVGEAEVLGARRSAPTPAWSPTTVSPPWRSIASRSRRSRAASAAWSWALIITSTCDLRRCRTAPPSAPGRSRRRRRAARRAPPCRRGTPRGKPSSDVPGTPSASRPA